MSARSARETNLSETVNLLHNVSGQETPNQRLLAREIGISVGLVNSLVRRAVHKGLIKIKEAPARRYRYYLTPKGLAEKSRLVAAYLDHSLTFFRTARQEYTDLFARCSAVGRRQVVLCGAGELAEIATLGVNGLAVELIAVFDRETNQSRIAGLPVIRDLAQLDSEVLFVVTDGRNAQEMHDRLVAMTDPGRVLYPKFLRILPGPEASKPGAL